MDKFKAPEVHCTCGHCHDEKEEKHHHHHHDECCEHEHHHHDDCCEHEHHHHDDCCCEHKHHHDGLHADIHCGCGHCHDDEDEHEEKEESKGLELGLLIGSAVLTLVAFILHLTIDINPIALGIMCGIATLACGYETFIEGIKSLFKLKLDETTLLAIAVVAAFCLGEFTEAAFVTLLFQLGEFLEDFAVKKSQKSIESLAEIRPDTAILVTPEGEKEVPAEKVPVGSTILVKPYERIPLDGVICEGSSAIDTSTITGESIPLDGVVGTDVMSSMQNGESVIKITTTKTADNSAASRILKMVQDSQQNKGDSEKFITRFARVYTPIVVVIAILVAVIPTIFGGTFSVWLYRALVCLVASCPCAIVISVPLAFFAGIGGASKRGIMIKGGKYIESVAKADCFVFDKTGTLTNGKIKVTKVTSYGEISENDILKFSATAEEYSAHPIAQAIKQKAKLENVETLKADDYQEKAGNGVTAIIDGKNYTVGHIGLLSEEDKKKVTDDTSVFLLIDGKLVGGITVNDTIRTETPKVLKSLKELGAKDLVMLTGDNKKKAESVAKLTGITKLFSNLLPNEKVKHMEELKKSHKATVFVGDGINDAPVIALADCGVAMGLGSDAAIEASDAVLSDGTLKSLPTMVKTSRRIMNTIRAVITFALVVKALVIVLAIFGIAPMWLGVLSDTGLSMICILYAMRLLKPKD